MGCGNTKQREPHRAPVATATVPPQQQVYSAPPQFEQNEPELQQYQQNYNNNDVSTAYPPAANDATTTTTVTTTNTMREPLPSAPCDDLEVPQHEAGSTNNLYAEQKPPSIELSEVQFTRMETPPQQPQKPVTITNPPVPTATVTTTTYVQEPKPNMSGANTNGSISNGKASGKEHAHTVIDENGQEVRLPKGNWFKAEGTEYYYSAIENLYYHPPSKQFYDPTNEMWYDPSTREWYRDDATEDDSAAVRA